MLQLGYLPCTACNYDYFSRTGKFCIAPVELYPLIVTPSDPFNWQPNQSFITRGVALGFPTPMHNTASDYFHKCRATTWYILL